MIGSYSWMESAWTLRDLPNGEPFTFYLAQADDLGSSEPAGPFTVVLSDGTTGPVAPGVEPAEGSTVHPVGPTQPPSGSEDQAQPDDDDSSTTPDRPGSSRLAGTGGAAALVLLVAAGAVVLGTAGVRRARRAPDGSR